MSSFRQLAWFFQRHWKRYVFAISVLIIIDILLLLPPRIIGSLVDEIRNGLLTHKGLVMMVVIEKRKRFRQNLRRSIRHIL
ncbi:hypothetical protein [Brevibacillus laterosporus]|uniref:hypothetical protein n=1 Tax=Brevibacillus laterosporus TaxID=1465 RepID=UPI0014442099|nr:hypothetical protein [Brevibacillus laterosporus]NKQ19658.1 hypothetical protein [Brevibacillus laterosporus]WNX30798.1 hypothetical protein RWW94_21845 [Brevibacillus laterosporus]